MINTSYITQVRLVKTFQFLRCAFPHLHLQRLKPFPPPLPLLLSCQTSRWYRMEYVEFHKDLRHLQIHLPPKWPPKSDPESLGFRTIRLAHQFHRRCDWPEGHENTCPAMGIGIFQVTSNLKNKISCKGPLKNQVPVAQPNFLGGQSGDISET